MMNNYLTKTTNPTALVISKFHPTFEQCLEAVSNAQFKKDLRLKNHPLSAQYVLVESYVQGALRDKLSIEKRAVEIANQDPLALYHLFAGVLNHFENH